MKPPDPGCIALRNVQHIVDNTSARRTIVHVLHLLKQTIKLGALVVRGILAVFTYFLIRTIQQEQKIFGVRIVGIPTPAKDLSITLAHLFLKAIVVGGAPDQLDIELLKLFTHPIEISLSLRSRCRRIKVQQQWFTGDIITTITVAGLRQETLCDLDRLSS